MNEETGIEPKLTPLVEGSCGLKANCCLIRQCIVAANCAGAEAGGRSPGSPTPNRATRLGIRPYWPGPSGFSLLAPPLFHSRGRAHAVPSFVALEKWLRAGVGGKARHTLVSQGPSATGCEARTSAPLSDFARPRFPLSARTGRSPGRAGIRGPGAGV